MPFAHTDSYDWSCLVNDNGRMSYVVDGETRSRLGIDVSRFQESINWNMVKDDGIEFAFIRLGYRDYTTGELGTDLRFEENMDGAYEAGVLRGVYFFSQAVTVEEAHEEAKYVLEVLDGRPLDYPVVFDSEEVAEEDGRTVGLTKDEMTTIALAFCEDIEKAGYTPMVYGNNYDMSRYDLAALSSYGRWYAGYSSVPSADFDFAIWQYTDHGEVAGITEPVDMNLDLTPAW